MEFSQFDTNSLMYITNRPDIVFTEGEGMWLKDSTGKRYLDYLQGWAVNSFGHSPAIIQDAVITQVKKLINPSPAFYNAPMIELASLLTHNSTFDRVFFANSGGEANEGAIKLARKWGQKHPNAKGEARFEIITFDHSFHGRTIATMSASGKEGWDKKFAPQVPGFPKADLNDLDSVKKLVNDRTVAVMLEPVQGEGGVIPADAEFLKALRQFTQNNHLLLIVDEVQTGMGRTGKLFAHQWAGIAPDIMTLAKGIGGGVPLAALLATESASVFEAGDQGGTFNGNPLCTAVGVAIIKHLLEPGFLDHIKAMGDYLSQQLKALSQRFDLGEERGEGLLRALELGSDIGNQIVEVSRELEPIGLLVNAPRAHLLRFMPALNVTKEEIDTLISMLSDVLTKIKK